MHAIAPNSLALEASAAPPGDSGGEQPPADASSRAIVFFDALAFDPTDLVVNDACPALAEHLRIDPSTPCTILGDGDSRSAAATRLAFFAVELDGRAGSVFHVADDVTPGDAAAAPDIFAETAQRLAATLSEGRWPKLKKLGISGNDWSEAAKARCGHAGACVAALRLASGHCAITDAAVGSWPLAFNAIAFLAMAFRWAAEKAFGRQPMDPQRLPGNHSRS